LSDKDQVDNSPEGIKKAVEERVKKAKKATKPKPKKEKPKVTSIFVTECLLANELGDGMLYAAIHEDKFLFNKSADDWLSWQGHHWGLDIMKSALSSVEYVAQRFLSEAHKKVDQIGEAIKNQEREKVKDLQGAQDKIFKRVSRLRSERGRNNCLKFAHTNTENQVSIRGDELDTNPWLLACKNGVIDLRTGDLRKGRPDDYISKASPIEWTGKDTPAKNWELALRQIFQGDQSMVDYLGRMFGYGITGLTIEDFLPVLWGKGRNGKTTIVETISHVMGDLAAPIQSEMLLDQAFARSAAGPSPDIMSLRGLRLAFASETDQGRRFSLAKVKLLTGSDTLKGRLPHDKYETIFKPTHLLLLLTNNKPQVYDDDFAFWERMHLIPFKLSFVDREPENEFEKPVDKKLRLKLIEEAPGILAWLVRGCLAWQKEGLKPTPEIIDATKEYRADEDLLLSWVQDFCFKDPKTETPSSVLYDSFKKWWDDNVSRKVVSQKAFGNMMVKKFTRYKSGTYRYVGIGLNEIIGDE